MRRIYLIRHARPDIPLGVVSRCIGRTDVPLGIPGKLQSIVLGEYMQHVPVSGVFCSHLSRAVETARAISPDPVIVPGLEEMDAGDWDGLYFDEIRRRWPDIYEKRGIDPSFPIPGAEPVMQAHLRFRAAVAQILRQYDGDIAIVAHATVIQSFLSFLQGTDVEKCREYRLDYTGICTVGYEEGRYTLLEANRIPFVPLTEQLCIRFLEAAAAPADHCREVARTALAIAREVSDAGIHLDPEQIRFGALLHDIARREPDHPVQGARMLEMLGYADIARIVRTHHDPDTEQICESTIVFLADKLPLEQRFARSIEKCTTEEARAAHRRRCCQAAALKERINALCGKEIIQ